MEKTSVDEVFVAGVCDHRRVAFQTLKRHGVISGIELI